MISAKYDTNHIFFYYDKRKNQIKCLDYQKMIVMEFSTGKVIANVYLDNENLNNNIIYSRWQRNE